MTERPLARTPHHEGDTHHASKNTKPAISRVAPYGQCLTNLPRQIAAKHMLRLLSSSSSFCPPFYSSLFHLWLFTIGLRRFSLTFFDHAPAVVYSTTIPSFPFIPGANIFLSSPRGSVASIVFAFVFVTPPLFDWFRPLTRHHSPTLALTLSLRLFKFSPACSRIFGVARSALLFLLSELTARLTLYLEDHDANLWSETVFYLRFLIIINIMFLHAKRV